MLPSHYAALDLSIYRHVTGTFDVTVSVYWLL